MTKATGTSKKSKSARAGAAFRRPPTAQAAVLAELRGWILSGRLRPGDQVRSDAIGEELGMSRVPVREALRILEGEGQVTYVPHQGYFVSKLSLDDLLEVYRIREILEEEAVRTAIPLMSEEDVDRMVEAMADMKEASAAADIISHTAANRRYHFAVFEAAQMPHLVRIIRMMWDSTDPYRSLYYNDKKNRQRVEAEHREILAAVRDRDADRTVALLTAHRQHAIEALREILEPVTSEGDAA